MKNSFLRLKVNENTASGASSFSALFTRVCDGEEIMKGKPWSIEEEKQLRPLLESKKYVNVIAEALGKTVDSVKSKMRRLGLKEEDTAKKNNGVFLF